MLALLPVDWDMQVWQAAREEWNNLEDQQHRDALAASLLAPIRPEEFIPSERPHGWSPGVVVERRSAHCIALTIVPVKTHGGSYGTLTTTILIDPTKAGDVAVYLAGRCAAAGGRLVVSIGSKNTMRKKLGRLGQHALPGDVTITPYVCRHQLVADYKRTLGAGAKVAAAAGQCNDRTQAGYGNVAYGRMRAGIIGIESGRTPRAGNVARAHKLAATRRRRRSKDVPPEEPGS